MKWQKEEQPGADEEAASGDAPAATDTGETPVPQARTFIVKHPTIINGHINGLLIKNGVCETTDGIKAHASQEFGCTVTDKATGEPAW